MGTTGHQEDLGIRGYCAPSPHCATPPMCNTPYVTPFMQLHPSAGAYPQLQHPPGQHILQCKHPSSHTPSSLDCGHTYQAGAGLGAGFVEVSLDIAFSVVLKKWLDLFLKQSVWGVGEDMLSDMLFVHCQDLHRKVSSCNQVATLSLRVIFQFPVFLFPTLL